MLRATARRGLKYIQGVRAKTGGSVAALLDNYLEQDGAAKHAANSPASQRYYYTKPNTVNTSVDADGTLRPQHRVIQLRLGAAQMLAPTGQGGILNSNGAHPLFYAQTSPRQAGLCLPLVTALRQLRIGRLTELQGALIPLLLQGKHVIAHAETGTGKSFGIALAIANRILQGSINYRLHTLILVPTEELALQYDKWLRHFGGCTSQIVQAAVDGVPLEAQLARLHNVHPHVLVGTPQRLADINRLSPTILGEKLRRKVDCVVLDEADLILSTKVRVGRQTLTGANLVDRLFRSQRDEVPAQLVAASATIDGVTAQTLNAWARNDKAVRLTSSFVEHAIPATILFHFFSETRGRPLPKVLELILRLICKQTAHPRVLLLTEASQVAEVSRLLREEIQPNAPEAAPLLNRRVHEKGRHGVGDAEQRYFADVLHSCRAEASTAAPAAVASPYNTRPWQITRERGGVYIKNNSTLSLFNEGRLLIGVGSFEMSRGLHVRGVTHVVLYGACPSPSHFVHCAGRTGRMGAEGDVITLFPRSSGRAVQQVCESLDLDFSPGKLDAVERLLSDGRFASAESLRDLEDANASLEAEELERRLAFLRRESAP